MDTSNSFRIAADGSRVVPLEKGVIGHGGQVSEVKLRPPTYRDFMDLGDPTTLVVSANAMVPHDDLDTIRGYIERIGDLDAILMEKVTLRDAMALRDAVKSFFTAGSASASTTSPTT